MKIDLNHIPASLGAQIDIAPIKATIANLRQVRKSAGHRTDLGRRIKRTVIALLRQLIRAEDFNLRVLLKWEMLGNRLWRQRVMDDLGGEPALKRWEARKVKAQDIILDPRIVPYRDEEDIHTPKQAPARDPITIPGVQATEVKAVNIKIDRDGLFRLAPIRHKVRPLTVQEDFARWEAKTWRDVMRPCPKVQTSKSNKPETFKPIPITPDELRGETPDECQAERSAAEIRDDMGSHLPQSTPCPNPAPLLETRSLFLIPDKRGSP